MILLLPWVVPAQQVTFSKLISLYPLNGEVGIQVREVKDGYLFTTQNDCVTYPYNICSTIAKTDIGGNILWQTELEYWFGAWNNFIETDEYYYFIGSQGSVHASSMIAFTKQGALAWDWKITNTNFKEISNGFVSGNLIDEYWIYGSRDRTWIAPNHWWPYIMKISAEGDTLQRFFYNDDYRGTYVSKVIENTWGDLMAAYSYDIPGLPWSYYPGGAISFTKDGEIRWRLELPESLWSGRAKIDQVDSSTFALQWVGYLTGVPEPLAYPPAFYYLDRDGHILDTLILNHTDFNGISATHAIWDQGLVGCGFHILDYWTNSPGHWTGWVIRVNEKRELAWQRHYADTTYGGVSSRLYYIEPTSDGGFISIGSVSNNMTGVFETHVWLLKLDSMGCLIPDCDSINIITTTEPVAFPSGLVLTLYPNPATAEFNLKLPPEAPDHDLLVSLLSSSGQVLRQQSYHHPAIRFDTAGLPPGMYYVTVHRKGSLLGVEKLILTR